MKFSEELIKDLEPVISDVIEKNNSDVVAAFDEILEVYTEQIISAMSEINTEPQSQPSDTQPSDDSVVLSKIDGIKTDTKQILGTVTDIKTDLQSFIEVNEKAQEQVKAEYGKNAEEQNKKMEKLQKTAKASLDKQDNTKSFFKKLGKFLLGGAIFFLFGDIIKDLVVSGFDKFIHSPLANDLKDWIDKNFPRFGETLTQLGKWWDDKALPWLDTHSFAQFFSNTFTTVANIWDNVVKLTNKLGWTATQTDDPVADLNTNTKNRQLGRETINIDPSQYQGIVDEQTMRALLAAYPQGVVTRIIQQEAQIKEKYPDLTRARTIDPISGAELLQTPEQFVANVADPNRDKWIRWGSNEIATSYDMNRAVESAAEKYYPHSPETQGQFQDVFSGFYQSVTANSANYAGQEEQRQQNLEEAARRREEMSMRPQTHMTNTTVVNNYIQQINPPAGGPDQE